MWFFGPLIWHRALIFHADITSYGYSGSNNTQSVWMNRTVSAPTLRISVFANDVFCSSVYPRYEDICKSSDAVFSVSGRTYNSTYITSHGRCNPVEVSKPRYRDETFFCSPYAVISMGVLIFSIVPHGSLLIYLDCWHLLYVAESTFHHEATWPPRYSSGL